MLVDELELKSKQIDGRRAVLLKGPMEFRDAAAFHQVIVRKKPEPRFAFREKDAALPLGHEIVSAEIFGETSIMNVERASESVDDGLQRLRTGVVTDIDAKAAIGLRGDGSERLFEMP